MPTPNSLAALLSRPFRLFRFGLRAIFVVIAVFAVWLSLHVRSAHLQKNAVTALIEAGGQVGYEYQYPNGRFGRSDFDYLAGSRVPRWAFDMFGVDFFHDVVEVDIKREYGYSRQNPDADNELLRQLHSFPKLRILQLSHCGITDEGMRNLPDLPLLEVLDLSYASITDDSLPYVSRFTRLKSLGLAHTRVNGRGFHRLLELHHLQDLNLTLTPTRDKGLRTISNMDSLKYLSVYRCRHLTRECVTLFRQEVPTCYVFVNDKLLPGPENR